MNIVLLGAPGAGKGTQAAYLEKKYDLVHISTGDIFRANIKGGTPIGKVAKSYIDAGKLVPDEVTCDIVRDRLAWDDIKGGAGFMLDGFPRNLFQAQELDKFAKIDACVNISVDAALLMDRICGRRVCSCGASYHISTLGGTRNGGGKAGNLQYSDRSPHRLLQSAGQTAYGRVRNGLSRRGFCHDLQGARRVQQIT